MTLEQQQQAIALLKKAAATFREYEAHHRAKLHEGDARVQRAERNHQNASEIEALLSDIESR